MNYVLTIFEVLLAAATVLMAGTIIARNPGQSLRDAIDESLAWGAGFFFSYGTLILVFEILPSDKLLNS